MGIAASLSYTFSLQRYLTTSRGAMSRRSVNSKAMQRRSHSLKKVRSLVKLRITNS
ncbi:hypothetical protein [Nostoc sp.]|uniref:hypothetical protein n=1 Tax=Nostoc sp. TaxID=1180 RepID=UPI002FF9D13E